jgi:hypothetical protein
MWCWKCCIPFLTVTQCIHVPTHDTVPRKYSPLKAKQKGRMKRRTEKLHLAPRHLSTVTCCIWPWEVPKWVTQMH